ncbi:hypothetical protein M5K25_002202 [Dendrobium thyrsiflorum]|uniref:Uncharacterized protein n=1 Tax=Dendrobium thyrsiflorum TaxID=117978 RepID=A0ABD0VSE2_DENTH
MEQNQITHTYNRGLAKAKEKRSTGRCSCSAVWLSFYTGFDGEVDEDMYDDKHKHCYRLGMSALLTMTVISLIGDVNHHPYWKYSALTLDLQRVLTLAVLVNINLSGNNELALVLASVDLNLVGDDEGNTIYIRCSCSAVWLSFYTGFDGEVDEDLSCQDMVFFFKDSLTEDIQSLVIEPRKRTSENRKDPARNTEPGVKLICLMLPGVPPPEIKVTLVISSGISLGPRLCQSRNAAL